jgi:hypothetical protein
MRRSVDGRDIYVILPPDAVAANPSYILGMRALRCRRRGWLRFLFNAHSVMLVTLGLIVGALVSHGMLSPEASLMCLPMGLIYYVCFAQVGVNVAEDLRRRGHLQDLYMISFYDYLLLGAGIVCVEKYQRARVGAAAAAFAGVALVTAGMSDPATLSRHVAVGGLLLFFGLIVAARSARLRKRRETVVGYREMSLSLSRLAAPLRVSMRQTVGLTLACAAATGVVVVGVFVAGGMQAEVAAVLCLGAFFAFRRSPAPDAPTLAGARDALCQSILDALQK